MSTDNSSAADLQRIINFLGIEGYRPKRLTEATIMFHAEGDNFFVIQDASDVDFYQIVYPFRLDEITNSEQDVLRACNGANSDSKLAKVYFENDTVFITVQILGTPIALKNTMPRYISALKYAQGRLRNHLSHRA